MICSHCGDAFSESDMVFDYFLRLWLCFVCYEEAA